MNKLFGIVIGSAAMAVVSMVVSAAAVIRASHTIKKIDKSIGKVEEMTEEKISENMIRKAVSIAADIKVDRYMKDTQDEVLRTASRNLDIQARNAVEACAGPIRDQAAERISQQVADLDIEKLKTRVCDQAEKRVLEKLDGCLDASAKKFQQNLDNAELFYGKFAKAMAEKKLKEENDTYHVVLI